MAYLKELRAKYVRKRVDDDLLKKPVETAKQVYRLFKDMEDTAREKVICLHLNAKLEVMSYEVIAIGTIDRVLMDPRELFASALLARAHSMIVVHNHPSGDSDPTPEDKVIAETLAEYAPKITPLLDFIIIGDQDYFSFHEKNLLTPSQ